MATSGTTTFSQNCNTLILQTLDLLGVHGKGMTVDAEDMTYCRNALNLMVKGFMTSNIHLWTKTEAVLYVQQYQAKYDLNNTPTSAYVTFKDDELVTNLNSKFTVGDPTITVKDSTGMSVNDYIGVVLDDLSLFWTTISAVNSSTIVTLTTYPALNISNNAYVYSFTNRITKPMRVLDARWVTGIDSGVTNTKTELMLNPMPYETYMHMTSKETNGATRQYTFNPERDRGVMFLWPRPNDCTYRVEFTYERILEDLDTATDDFDFPNEWQETLIYNLAVRICPRWGKEEKVLKLIQPMASGMLSALLSWDTEITSVYMMPNDRVDT